MVSEHTSHTQTCMRRYSVDTQAKTFLCSIRILWLPGGRRPAGSQNKDGHEVHEQSIQLFVAQVLEWESWSPFPHTWEIWYVSFFFNASLGDFNDVTNERLLSVTPDDSERTEILRAMKDFEYRTCIRFIPRASQRVYLSIEPKYGWVRS